MSFTTVGRGTRNRQYIIVEKTLLCRITDKGDERNKDNRNISINNISVSVNVNGSLVMFVEI